MHRRSLRLAEKVVCISRATKESAMRHFGIPEQKCVVVPIAAMPLAAPVVVNDLPEKFFLFAGVLKERKNVATLIRAFALFCKKDTEHQFLIAGKTRGAYYESLQALVRDLGISGRVRFLGYVSDGELAYLYSRAAALVFASLIEGFGMPVLEAFTAGCPVITSNEGALAEVAGDAALTCDPRSPEALAACMRRIATDPGLRDELNMKGKLRAKEFSWEKAVRAILALL
jgi:glycosyltransferase involved in cell wall biosynthesis